MKTMIKDMRHKFKDLSTTKIVLISLIILTGLLDIITFFMGNHEFEANPLYLLLNSFVILIVFKVIVLAYIIYLLIKYVPKKRFIWAFMLSFIAIYCIFAQSVGVYSNLKVQHEIETNPPGTIMPLEKQEAMLNYSIIFGVIILYLPMLLSFVSFWVFERIYLIDL